jgi:hypothetical protein
MRKTQMNERIKQLAEQAGFAYEPSETLQKFAELIVRECADIAKHHVMNISTYADADFVDEQIKEHFGVEE